MATDTGARGRKWSGLGARLKRARERAGLVQAQVAEALGVSEHAVWYWESGRSRPTLDRLSGLAALYGVSLGALVDGEAFDSTSDLEIAVRGAQRELPPEDLRTIEDLIAFLRDRRRRAGNR